MTGFSTLTIENRDATRIVTIARPERRNALGTQTMAELSEAFEAAGRDAVSAIVLAGMPPAFCAGSDLKELAGLSPAEMADHERPTGDVARSIASLDIPVIAAVEGYALGGGLILAASCDIVVAAENVRWLLPEVKNGWLPPWGLGALKARVGSVNALQLTWGYKDCDGAEAYRLGLADVVCSSGQALDTSLSIAEKISLLPRHSVSSAKKYFNRYRQDDVACDEEASRQFEIDASSPVAQTLLARFGAKA